MAQDKRLAAMIVAKAAMPTAKPPMKKGPSPDNLHRQGDSSNGPNDSAEAGEGMEGHHEAAKDMMDAMQNNDHEGYAAALKDFISMCHDSDT